MAANFQSQCRSKKTNRQLPLRVDGSIVLLKDWLDTHGFRDTTEDRRERL
jgi:hypothetical protein